MTSHIDGLVQERRSPSALAVELRLSCFNPSICTVIQDSDNSYSGQKIDKYQSGNTNASMLIYIVSFVMPHAFLT